MQTLSMGTNICFMMPILLSITGAAGWVILLPQGNYIVFQSPKPAIFMCSGDGNIAVWTLNGNLTNGSGVTITPYDPSLGAVVPSHLSIIPNANYNNTEVVCATISVPTLNIFWSSPTLLIIQGPLDAPSNFSVNISNTSNTTFLLSWGAPFSLNITDYHPNIFYYTLCSNIIIYGCRTVPSDPDCTFPRTCTSSVDFADPSLNGTNGGQNKTIMNYSDPIHFTFFAVNGAGNGAKANLTYLVKKKSVMSRRKQTLCLDEVLGLIDDDDDEPMMEGSEDKMDDLELDTDEMQVEADEESITQTTTHPTVMSTSTCGVHVQEGSSSSGAAIGLEGSGSLAAEEYGSDTALDTLGHHAVTCKRGGDVVTRHSCLRDTFVDLCRNAHLSVQVEYLTLDNSARLMSWRAIGIGGNLPHLTLQFLLPYHLPSYLRLVLTQVQPPDQLRNATEHRANDVKCAELGWSSVPLAVETYGAWVDEAQCTFSRLASLLSVGFAWPKEVYPDSQLKTKLRGQKLSYLPVPRHLGTMPGIASIQKTGDPLDATKEVGHYSTRMPRVKVQEKRTAPNVAPTSIKVGGFSGETTEMSRSTGLPRFQFCNRILAGRDCEWSGFNLLIAVKDPPAMKRETSWGTFPDTKRLTTLLSREQIVVGSGMEAASNKCCTLSQKDLLQYPSGRI
eukprot:Em0001g3002a